MSNCVENSQLELNTAKKCVTYEIMHMEKIVATISTLGQAKILNAQFMPYDIYLEESNDIYSKYRFYPVPVIPLLLLILMSSR